MPIDPEIIQGGLQFAESGIDALTQIIANKQNRKYADAVYAKQRKDAIADRDYADKYNSPAATKARLQSAGLNPALMYGGNQSAPVSAMIRGSQPPSFKYEKIPVNPALMSIPAQIQQMQTVTEGIRLDNQKKSIDLVQQQEVQQSGSNPQMLDSQLKQVALNSSMEQYNILKTTSQDQIQQIVQKSLTSVQEAMTAKFKNVTMNQLEADKARQEIENLKLLAQSIAKDIENKTSSNIILDAQAELAELGIFPGDKLWQRKLIEKVSEHKIIPKLLNKLPKTNEHPYDKKQRIKQKEYDDQIIEREHQ